MSNRTLKVKGVGKASMAPDAIKINIILKSADLSYEETMDMAAEKLKDLEELLQRVDFKKEDLKTVKFKVDTKYEDENTSLNTYKRKFVGYQLEHLIKIMFENDPIKLGRVLNAISKSKAKPEFSIIYTLKDGGQLKESMIKEAIRDAKEKALIIAQASDIELGEILNINYNLNDEEIFQSPISLQRNIGIMSQNLSIVPEDLEASDTIEISWEID